MRCNKVGESQQRAHASALTRRGQMRLPHRIISTW